MIRNFVAGIVWGGVVGVVGLGIVSQLAPSPAPMAANLDAPLGQAAAPAQTETAPTAPVEAPATAEPVAVAPEAQTDTTATAADAPSADAKSTATTPPSAPAVAEPATAPAESSSDASTPAAAPSVTDNGAAPAEPPVATADPNSASVSEAPATAPTEASPPQSEPTAAEPAPPAPATQGDTSAPAETQEAPPAVTESAVASTASATPEPPPSLSADAPTAPQPPVAASVPPGIAPATEASPQAAVPPGSLPAASGGDAVPAAAQLPPAAPVAPAETLLTPAPDLQADQAPAQIVLDPVPEPTPTAPVPEVTPLPEVAPLPTVEDAAKPSTLAPAPGLNTSVSGVAENTLPQIGVAPAAVAEPAPVVDSRPIISFARSFTNDSGKPEFAIVLRDTGAADVDRATLAALPFPVSFVIDPAQPDAAAHAAIYRAAGQEVVMLATGIPEGATAADLEQSFQANAAVLPEAVAVMDLGAAGFQDNRLLAAQVVPVIGAQGRGVLTFDLGLNAADQVARREHVPAAVIFRDLDAEGEDTQKIRRYLDRAAFKAAQEGSVVVVGSTRPETIEALMEWTVEGRASSVELAPLTAVLTVQ